MLRRSFNSSVIKIQTPRRDSMERKIAERFAEFGASISYEEIPPAVIERPRNLSLIQSASAFPHPGWISDVRCWKWWCSGEDA